MSVPETPSAEQIARRLSRGQRSTILGLGEGFCILGCSEPTAIRLCKGTDNRPALVQSRPGDPYKEFALNDLGLQVRALLTGEA